MQPTASQSRLRRPSGLRAGIVIGAALALVGIGVGTAVGAPTPFQQVVVRNTATEPIPVVGTVNVGNTPANQSVTVSNFPATQPVSGTVSVGTTANKHKIFVESLDAGGGRNYAFGETVNVTSLVLENGGSDDEMTLYLLLPGVANATRIHTGDGGYKTDFTVPVPATGVRVFCGNAVLSCDVNVAVFGT